MYKDKSNLEYTIKTKIVYFELELFPEMMMQTCPENFKQKIKTKSEVILYSMKDLCLKHVKSVNK